MDTTVGGEFAPTTTYLNTAAHGLLPASAVAALRDAAAEIAEGRVDVAAYFEDVRGARSAFGRLVGVPPERVAVGAAVSLHVALVAGALPPGAEVLCAEQEFSSLVTPFAQCGARLRTVPLTALAEAVRAGTALVAVSAVQSLDGRIADLPAIGAAARRHGARTLVDLTQAAGWYPVSAADFDFTVCAGYKWLMCPRGVSFLTVPADGGGLTPLHAGWVAGEEPWNSTYGPVTRPARSARRFDESPAFLSWVAGARSLELLAGLDAAEIGAHDLRLARRFRGGVAALGFPPVPADSAVVSVPGLGGAARALTDAGVRMAVRGGLLRAAFHLYNTEQDVDRALDVLASAAGTARG
ncbi:aminotransferase class V-fold PLP-dependent enzyme [Streptomyces johnsoniae]|uniref:Aminotransferase class V-fold PLP-dependent enzyme n=1 Tax=Streptomyces johnsoniae TaxID=3075532 RepID=A0ABU2S9Q2_9ACTN|nr:aminotransferase class V-fold PLP-dependent enzyme [Streptomyces sp. DSM 41886]MDT0444539.1 aminotransferase class V-fold PLP-dependent enzyme [Streptomyces sp. DSM 41886]